jgi:hypothetical protein
MLTKIISGGQIGADLGALHGAKSVGFPTGGTAPPGWISGGKPQKELLQSFGMVEGAPDPYTYPKRTMKNVDDSDGTVAILWGYSVGTLKTIGYAISKNWRPGDVSRDSGYRPVLVIKHKEVNKAIIEVVDFIKRNNISILNVAGHRETSQPGIASFTNLVISRVIVYLEHWKPQES